MYKKSSLDCIVIPQKDENGIANCALSTASCSLLDASISSVFVPDVLPTTILSNVNEKRREMALPVLEVTVAYRCDR